jgi:Cupin
VALPPVIHVRGVRGRPLPWVAATLRLVGAETDATAPGSEAVVGRLADAPLTQALRVAVAAELDAADGGRCEPCATRTSRPRCGVALVAGALMVWVWAPPSDQDAKT